MLVFISFHLITFWMHIDSLLSSAIRSVQFAAVRSSGVMKMAVVNIVTMYNWRINCFSDVVYICYPCYNNMVAYRVRKITNEENIYGRFEIKRDLRWIISECYWHWLMPEKEKKNCLFWLRKFRSVYCCNQITCLWLFIRGVICFKCKKLPLCHRVEETELGIRNFDRT